MQMFPLMRTFAIIGILLVNVYSTRKYLVEVGNERSEEDEASGHSDEDEYNYQSYVELTEEEKKENELREAEYMEYRKKDDEDDKKYGYEWMKG